jgi:tight adherence protein C
MLLPLVILLVLLAALAVAIAVLSYSAERRRRETLRRAIAGAESELSQRRVMGSGGGEGAPNGILLNRRRESNGWMRTLVGRVIPQGWLTALREDETLVKAGFEGSAAPVTYALLQAGALVVLPLLALWLAAGEGPRAVTVYLLIGVAAAWLIPNGYVARRTRLRQQRIRRALPDALDLLLVCVEAGSSFDAALLRVARETQALHPDLAGELLIATRKMNHGMPRERALREMWERTGVDELRSLIANVIQSDRWGTSLGRVLRVSAGTMRRKRRQGAEKEAQTAPLKMTLPLVALILPALLIVVMGPAMLTVIATFKSP